MTELELGAEVHEFLAKTAWVGLEKGALILANADVARWVTFRDGEWVGELEERGVRDAPDFVTDSAEAVRVLLVLERAGTWRRRTGLLRMRVPPGEGPIDGFGLERVLRRPTLTWSDEAGLHYARVQLEYMARELAVGLRIGLEALMEAFKDPEGAGLLVPY